MPINIIRWWKEKRLAPPHQIVRRLLAYPFIQVSRGLCVLFVFIGWGKREAKDYWRQMQ